MKRILTAMIAAALLVAGGAASALAQASTGASADQSADQGTSMGVVVNVDVHGRVTQARHAQKLPDNVEKLLRKTLDQWITKPAIVNGRRVDSQVFFTVVLRSEKQPDGNYVAKFDYVSSQPVPSGYKGFEVVNGNVVMTEGARSLRYDQDAQQAARDRPVVHSTTNMVNGSQVSH